MSDKDRQKKDRGNKDKQNRAKREAESNKTLKSELSGQTGRKSRKELEADPGAANERARRG